MRGAWVGKSAYRTVVPKEEPLRARPEARRAYLQRPTCTAQALLRGLERFGELHAKGKSSKERRTW